MLSRSRSPNTSSLSLLSLGGLLQRRCACGQKTVTGEKCDACRQGRSPLRRRAHQASAPATAPPIVQEVLRSPGQPLDRATRIVMESQLGYDFGHVRIHTDAKAAESAQAVHAQAYTVGAQIVFGPRQYQPHTPSGRSLLAHELTHVRQQRPVSPTHARAPLTVGPADSRYEREAETVAAGGPALAPSPSSAVLPPTLQRVCQAESFYQRAANYCRDDTFSPSTHPGQTCYRQIPVRSHPFSCPAGQHVCFDADGRCDESPDRSSLAAGKEPDGSCRWNYYCVAEHTAVDFVPAIMDQAAEPFREIGREFEKALDWRNWYRLMNYPF